jgi:hypothetical protein
MEFSPMVNQNIPADIDISGGKGDGYQIEAIIGKGKRLHIGNYKGNPIGLFLFGRLAEHGQRKIGGINRGAISAQPHQIGGHLAGSGTDIEPPGSAPIGGYPGRPLPADYIHPESQNVVNQFISLRHLAEYFLYTFVHFIPLPMLSKALPLQNAISYIRR